MAVVVAYMDSDRSTAVSARVGFSRITSQAAWRALGRPLSPCRNVDPSHSSPRRLRAIFGEDFRAGRSSSCGMAAPASNADPHYVCS